MKQTMIAPVAPRAKKEMLKTEKAIEIIFAHDAPPLLRPSKEFLPRLLTALKAKGLIVE